jgi:energy-coupling factor transport system permease protein
MTVRLLTPIRPDPRAPLAAANPVAKLGAAAILMATLFVSIDLLTPALVLLALFVAVPAAGVPPPALLARAWPLLIAATALVLLNAAFSADRSGTLLVSLGPLDVTTGSLVAGLAVGLRVLGVALAGLLAFVTTEPTHLADALQQQLHLPPRVAVGALAAVRLVPSIAAEWQILRLARRARGVSAGRSPLAAVRIFAGQLLSLLVSAIRRATRLATAMEARGFGSRSCRTVARITRMQRGDWLLLAASVLVGAAVIGLGMALGSWRFLFAAVAR